MPNPADSSITSGFTPVMFSPLLTFAIFIAVAQSQGRTLDTARMFVSLSFLTLISQPLSDLFQSVPMIMSMVGCFDRIEKFMQTDQWSERRHFETSSVSGSSSSDRDQISPAPLSEKNVGVDAGGEKPSTRMNAIEITGGAFGWENDSEPVVKNINLQIPSGSLVLLVGPVGCGKSTLLKAMLGEVPLSSGLVKLSTANLAYCDQTPWIVNGTFRENIAMFSDPEDPLYSTVLHACGLRHDLTQLPGGDRSNLGSKGITLSGGQKQRLASFSCRLNISFHALTNSNSHWPEQSSLDETSTYVTIFLVGWTQRPRCTSSRMSLVLMVSCGEMEQLLFSRRTLVSNGLPQMPYQAIDPDHQSISSRTQITSCA